MQARIRRKEIILFIVDNDRSIQINTVIKGISQQTIENKIEVFSILFSDIILNVIPLMVGSKKEKIIL